MKVKFKQLEQVYDREEYTSVSEPLSDLYKQQMEYLGKSHEDTLLTHDLYIDCLENLKQFEQVHLELVQRYELQSEMLGAFHSDTLETKFRGHLIFLHQHPQSLLLRCGHRIYFI